MNKNEVINTILDLFEENNALKNEVEFLKKKKNVKELETKEHLENDDSLEKRIYRIVLRCLYEDGFSESYMSKGWNNDKYPDLEKWSNDSINLRDYEEISIKEFKFLFGDKIKTAYDKKLEQAIERDKEEKE